MLLLGLSRFGGNLLKTFIPNNNSRKHSGFTLAEVLITLGIIGVVAAMTLPTLIQSYKKQVVETKLAKFYSMMNQAIKMAEAEYGEQSTWSDYHEDGEKDEEGNTLYNKGDKYDAHVKKYFAPYLKITNVEDITDGVSEGFKPQRVYYLADGTAFSFSLHENREIIFYTDNPKKCLHKPNASGTCEFLFSFIPGGYSISGYKYNLSNGMQPMLYQWDGKEESLMNGSTYSCKSGVGFYCNEIIRRNGWKIPDDYPRKF